MTYFDRRIIQNDSQMFLSNYFLCFSSIIMQTICWYIVIQLHNWQSLRYLFTLCFPEFTIIWHVSNGAFRDHFSKVFPVKHSGIIDTKYQPFIFHCGLFDKHGLFLPKWVKESWQKSELWKPKYLWYKLILELRKTKGFCAKDWTGR